MRANKYSILDCFSILLFTDDGKTVQTSLETVFRANSNLEPSATEEWLGPDITFDQINSAGLNAVNEPFWPGQ